jgi:cell division protein FtsW
MAIKIDSVRKDMRIFLFITMLLTLTGFIFIYSSSSVFALEKFGSELFFLKKQLFYFVPSLIGFFCFATISTNLLKKLSPYLFIGALFLTALTLIPRFGLHVHGSNRWLNLGGFSFQPSEFLKLFLFIYFGYFLEKKQRNIKSFAQSYLPFMAILGATFLILLKQPDFGSVMTILITSLTLFFVAEFRMAYLLGTILLATPAIAYLVFAKAYRLNRILIFLNPWSDPQGKGFQIIQSLIAIGSGHVLGLGISNSKQKFFYLPMQHTDFIFPIIAEETGFIGSCLILLLFVLFCFFGLRLILKFSDAFAFFTSLGFIVFISLQAVINLMVSCALLPTKGLGLPFISYGGTALVSFFCMVGLIVNFAKSNSRSF